MTVLVPTGVQGEGRSGEVARAAPASVSQAASDGWIESRAFDLSFFVLVPLVTLPIILLEIVGLRKFAALGFMLAITHYLSTLTFYVWDENHPHHRAHWVRIYAGPLILIGVYATLVLLRVPLIIQWAIFFWNTYHVARQNCGIASIYRHRAGMFDPYQKTVTNGAIIATSVFLSLWNIETHEQVWPVLVAISPQFPLVLRLAAGVAALACLARLAYALWVRHRAGRGVRLPEGALLLTGVLFFHPYLWLTTSAGATYAMLLPHYVQYLSLVWLLNRRKFPRPSGSTPQVWLQWIGANPSRLLVALAAAGTLLYGTKYVAVHTGGADLFEDLYLLVGLLHFYLDAQFWAFKDPHVRRSIAPYLTRGTAAASA